MSEPTDTVRYSELEGRYIERWACEPPAMDARYRVLEDEWDETSDPPVRIIKRIAVTG